MDYYEALRLTRDAHEIDVRKSFRKLALQFHPLLTREEGASAAFAKVCEAYEVLIDKQRRAVYDQFGHQGLQDGVPGRYEGGYKFSGNVDEVFAEFFGTANPFTDVAYDRFEVLKQRGLPPAPEVHVEERPLACTLEELYSGAIKRVDDHRGNVHSVAVLPGYYAGVRLTYPNDLEERKEAGVAVTYVVEEAKHPDFERRGDDLVHVARISLADALTECSVRVPMLDGSFIAVACDEIIRPGYERRIAGAGMPRAADPSERGDLVLRFDIEFPRHLDAAKRSQIRKLLQR